MFCGFAINALSKSFSICDCLTSFVLLTRNMFNPIPVSEGPGACSMSGVATLSFETDFCLNRLGYWFPLIDISLFY